MSLLDFSKPRSAGFRGTRQLLVAVMMLLAPLACAFAQEASVLEESDAILGQKPPAAAPQAGGPSVIGVADLREIMLFHPLMQHLVSTYGSAPFIYFLPPTASELTKLFDERRGKRLIEVHKEMTDLAEKSASLQSELFGLKDELNKRLGPGAAQAPEPAKRKAGEDGFWQRKQELTQRLAAMNERYATLHNEIQDPLKLLEQTRSGIVAKIRREADEAIAKIASERKLGIVLNAYAPAKEPIEPLGEFAPEPKPELGPNEYKEFFSHKIGSDKVEPTMAPRRLLLLWEARGPKVETVFGLPAARTVLYGGVDVTWPALSEILVRYNVPAAQQALLQAHFEARSQR